MRSGMLVTIDLCKCGSGRLFHVFSSVPDVLWTRLQDQAGHLSSGGVGPGYGSRLDGFEAVKIGPSNRSHLATYEAVELDPVI